MDIKTLSVDLDPVSKRKVVNDRFKLLETIGQGQFGKVMLAEDISGDKMNNFVAIKTINRVDKRKLITQTYMSHTLKIKREIQIMKECDHPNVVKLYLVIDDMKYDKILLVIEYCQLGEIDWKKYNHYHEKYFKDPAKGITLNKILRDVSNGLEYLHTFKHIIHRDLKPSNLLISHDRTIKISDFGVSLILENNANDDKELGKSMGTPAFFAPELCQFVNKRLLMLNEKDLIKSSIDARIDIWSLGVILYCLFFHQLPFEGFNEFGLFKNIVNGELKFPKTKEGSRIEQRDLRELELLKSLISRLLSKDPNKRPTIKEIKADQFTVFDLKPREMEQFERFNRDIMDSQLPPHAKPLEPESKLTSKIKQFFGGYNETTTAPINAKPIAMEPITHQEPINLMELGKVDDLLDSYLDDSSSIGSLEDDSEPEVVDTENLLASLSEKATKVESESTIKNSLSSHSNLLKLSRGSAPPPLKLSSSSFDSPTKKSSVNVMGYTSPSRGVYSGGLTPVSASSAVTIGAGSPLSIKSVFSPSRRFFSRIKKSKATNSEPPTINALLSPNHSRNQFNFTDLEPPPFFGREKRNSGAELIQSYDLVGKTSRKNSFNSVHSNPFSRMTSSNSSLNLHAYLTDDSHSRNSTDRGSLEWGGSRHSSWGRHSSGHNSSGRNSSGHNSLEHKPSEQSGLERRCVERNSIEKYDQLGDEIEEVSDSESEFEEANRTLTMDQYLDRLG